MQKKELVFLTPDEMGAVIENFMRVNKAEAAEGNAGLTVCFEGEAGVGKTSVPAQICKKNNYGYHALVLSQIEDIGDLVGFPYKSVRMQLKDSNGEIIGDDWFTESIGSLKKSQGWEYTEEIRTQYAEPEWLGKLRGYPNGSILLVDDFTRADMRFQQALMQLIQDGKYYSWKLPEGCSIVLSCNPNDEDYIVQDQDQAMSGRYCKFGVKFKIEDWVQWAIKSKIDGRCINIFINSYEEMMYSKDKNRRARYKMDVSPRDWSNFFRYCKHIPDFQDPSSLQEISRVGKAFVGDAVTIFMTQLTNKMDKLPSPEEILSKTDKELEKILLDVCGSTKSSDQKTRYRAEIASVIMMRFQYAMLDKIKTSKDLTKAIEDRIVFLMNSDSISTENKMNMMTLFHSTNNQAFQALVVRKEFRDKVLANFKTK
jgi:hypothetical protein